MGFLDFRVGVGVGGVGGVGGVIASENSVCLLHSLLAESGGGSSRLAGALSDELDELLHGIPVFTFVSTVSAVTDVAGWTLLLVGLAMVVVLRIRIVLVVLLEFLRLVELLGRHSGFTSEGQLGLLIFEYEEFLVDIQEDLGVNSVSSCLVFIRKTGDEVIKELFVVKGPLQLRLSSYESSAMLLELDPGSLDLDTGLELEASDLSHSRAVCCGTSLGILLLQGIPFFLDIGEVIKKILIGVIKAKEELVKYFSFSFIVLRLLFDVPTTLESCLLRWVEVQVINTNRDIDNRGIKMTCCAGSFYGNNI